MAGALGTLLYTSGANVLRVVRTRAWDAVKSVLWTTTVQTASYVAVDNVSNYVFGHADSSEQSKAETALDVLLSMYLAHNVRKINVQNIRTLSGAIKARASSSGALRYSASKKQRFLTSLGAVPWMDPRVLSATALAAGHRLRRSGSWFWSEAGKCLVYVGSVSGRVYGTVSKSGVTVNGIRGLDQVQVYTAAAAATTGAVVLDWAIENMTQTGLDVAAQQIMGLADEAGLVDPVDAMRASDNDADKLSFIRDPDMWLSSFGSDTTPGHVLVDRALDWFLGINDGSGVTVIDDVALLSGAKALDANADLNDVERVILDHSDEEEAGTIDPGEAVVVRAVVDGDSEQGIAAHVQEATLSRTQLLDEARHTFNGDARYVNTFNSSISGYQIPSYAAASNIKDYGSVVSGNRVGDTATDASRGIDVNESAGTPQPRSGGYPFGG